MYWYSEQNPKNLCYTFDMSKYKVSRPSTYKSAKGRCVNVVGKNAIATTRSDKQKSNKQKSKNPTLADEIKNTLGLAVLFENGIVCDWGNSFRTFFWEKNGELAYYCLPSKTFESYMNRLSLGGGYSRIFNSYRKDSEAFIKSKMNNMSYSELRAVLSECRYGGEGNVDKARRETLSLLINEER